MNPRVVLLSGGVGGAKLALGLYKVLPSENLTIIANTGDDLDWLGLKVCPDSDILTYTLAEVSDQTKGWGLEGESFRVLSQIRKYGKESWFNLGDLDLGTCLYRTNRLAEGDHLSEINQDIAKSLGVKSKILPMTESSVETQIVTENDVLGLQEYLVRDRAVPVCKEIVFKGVQESLPSPGILEALNEANVIIIAPSNPLISIAPILSVPGLKDTLQNVKGRKLAISPIVDGKSLKGPSDKMLKEVGHESTALGVARLYEDLVDDFVVDTSDNKYIKEIEDLGIKALCLSTVMATTADKIQLAKDILFAVKEGK